MRAVYKFYVCVVYLSACLGAVYAYTVLCGYIILLCVRCIFLCVCVVCGLLACVCVRAYLIYACYLCM